VCHSDGRAVLIDFGSVHSQGTSRLTWQLPPPGTPAYHSPEASLFMLRSVRSPFAYFEASPATDLFALGVTAYCLVMGEYPPRPEPSQDMEGAWHLSRQELRPLLERNPRVDPQLRECILRLLSMEPAARGTAAELVRFLDPSAGLAPLPSAAPQPAPIVADASPPAHRAAPGGVAPLEHASSRTAASAWRFWLALIAMGLGWFLEWSMRPSHIEPERVLASRQDTSSVGDSLDKNSRASAHVPAKQETLSQDTLPKPQPRQTQPDERGRCPGRKHVPLNGLCWLEYPGLTGEECKESGYAYIKGRCYAPVFTPHGKPQPTSEPADPP
jgi:serine/threonine protein kinase